MRNITTFFLLVFLLFKGLSSNESFSIHEIKNYAKVIVKSYHFFNESQIIQSELLKFETNDSNSIESKKYTNDLYNQVKNVLSNEVKCLDFNDFNYWIDKFYVFECILTSPYFIEEPWPSNLLALSYDGRFYYLKYFHKNDINLLIKDFIKINNESDATRLSLFYLSIINYSHHVRKQVVTSSNYEFYRTIYEKVSKPETFKKPEGYHTIIYAMDKYSEQVERYIFDIHNDNSINYKVEIIQKGTSENYLKNLKKYENKE
jgi:hypothetical protein